MFAFALFGVTEPKATGGVMCLVRCCEPEMEMIIVNGRDLYRSKGELARKSCYRWMGDPGRQPERAEAGELEGLVTAEQTLV